MFITMCVVIWSAAWRSTARLCRTRRPSSRRPSETKSVFYKRSQPNKSMPTKPVGD